MSDRAEMDMGKYDQIMDGFVLKLLLIALNSELACLSMD